MDAVEFGQLLAQRHEPAEPNPPASLLNYAESSRVDDWSFRSALMRMAQPEPERVAAVLTLSRRLDAVLHHVNRALSAHTVLCDRALALSADLVAPYADARAVDLARASELVPDNLDALLAGYEAATPLADEERMAVPLLGVALLFDRLADQLADWAADRSGPPPTELADATVAEVQKRLDALGVPEEQPPSGFRGRRGAAP